MAKLTEEARLNIWKNRVGWSRKFREQPLEKYDEYISYYEGEQYSVLNQSSIEGAIVINLIFAHIKASLPLLYFQNPHFYLRPKRSEFKENAPVSETVLNHYARLTKLKREMRLATLDALLMLGIMKVGYVPFFINNPKKGEKIIIGKDEDGLDIAVFDPDTGKPMEQPADLLIREKFFSKRVSPRNMLFDPEIENFLDESSWIGEEIVERLDDVKENELYNKKTRESIKETHMATKEVYHVDVKDEYIQDDIKRVKTVHVYDLKEESYKIFAEGQEDGVGFLYEDDIPEGIDGHPYSVLKFHEIPGKFFPLSEIKVLKPIQDDYNKLSSMIITHAKKFVRKYTYETGTFANDDEKEKFKEPIDGMMSEVNRNMSGKVVAVDDPQMDNALLIGRANLEQDFWKTAGASEAQRQVVERRKTAFEAGQISKFGEVRNQDKISLVEDFAKDTGNNLLNQLQANLRLPIALEIAGEEGKSWEENINKSRIYGDYDLEINIGATTPKIPEFEKQQLMTFLSAISQIPGIEQLLTFPVDKELDVAELIRQLGILYQINEYDIIKQRSSKQNPLQNPMMLQLLQQAMGGKSGGKNKNKKPQRNGLPFKV